MREPNLPAARLAGPHKDVRLLADYRESFVAERTRIISRLRWHLHELDPEWEPAARSLDRASAYRRVEEHLQAMTGLVADLAHRQIGRLRGLTEEINELEQDIATQVQAFAPTLMEVVGCGALTAAKIVGATADITRFKSKDAYARHNGTAPLPVWSSNTAIHRLSRTGNRQLNAALHRMALTQARWYPPPQTMLERRKAGGDGGLEALRILKRRLSDVVYAALRADARNSTVTAAA